MEGSIMRQHYRPDPKPMPYWLERCLDIALAVVIGLLLSWVLLWE